MRTAGASRDPRQSWARLPAFLRTWRSGGSESCEFTDGIGRLPLRATRFERAPASTAMAFPNIINVAPSQPQSQDGPPGNAMDSITLGQLKSAVQSQPKPKASTRQCWLQ